MLFSKASSPLQPGEQQNDVQGAAGAGRFGTMTEAGFDLTFPLQMLLCGCSECIKLTLTRDFTRAGFPL